MPIYEFKCSDCQKIFSVLIGMTADTSDDPCPNCGSKKSTKLVSRVSRVRSEEGRINEISDRLDSMGEPESHSQMREIAREMGSALDDDASDEMEALFESDIQDPDI